MNAHDRNRKNQACLAGYGVEWPSSAGKIDPRVKNCDFKKADRDKTQTDCAVFGCSRPCPVRHVSDANSAGIENQNPPPSRPASSGTETQDPPPSQPASLGTETQDPTPSRPSTASSSDSSGSAGGQNPFTSSPQSSASSDSSPPSQDSSSQASSSSGSVSSDIDISISTGTAAEPGDTPGSSSTAPVVSRSPEGTAVEDDGDGDDWDSPSATIIAAIITGACAIIAAIIEVVRRARNNSPNIA